MKYAHALFINPYIEKSATDTMMLFPPTGLEYVATSAKAAVERVTLLDLRYEPDFLEADTLNAFIKKNGVDIIGVGIAWDRHRILEQLNKGFNQETVRKAFAVLRKYPIFYAGYFIYGNVGEQEEEMLYIPRFAKEIGVDVIACNKLRIEKFSPLKELVQNTPGYHVTERGEGHIHRENIHFKGSSFLHSCRSGYSSEHAGLGKAARQAR